MAELLADADQLADYLGRTVDAGRAAVALAGASGTVRAYCGWSVSVEDTTFVADGPGGHLLTLPTMLLSMVTEVRVDGEALDPLDYDWSLTGQVRRAAGWPTTMRSIEVDAVHGYTDLPDAVTLVTLALAARAIENPGSLKSVAVGTVTRTWDAPGLSALDATLLSPYRLPMIP